jgi:hypothetical protein
MKNVFNSKPVDFPAWEREGREIKLRREAQRKSICSVDTEYQHKLSARGETVEGSWSRGALRKLQQIERKEAAEMDAFAREKFAFADAEHRRLAMEALAAVHDAAEKMARVANHEEKMELFCNRLALPARPRVADRDMAARAQEFDARVARLTNPPTPAAKRAPLPPLTAPDFESMAQ